MKLLLVSLFIALFLMNCGRSFLYYCYKRSNIPTFGRISTSTHLKQVLCRTVSTESILPDSMCKQTNSFRDLFSVAPMMEYTNSHQRKLQRWISSKSVLYTEMVTTNAIIHSDSAKQERLLEADFSIEDPLVLQLGGSDPKQMQTAAKIAVAYGYKEINLNVGCPSEKVAGAGCFGAALMLQPQLVCSLVSSIKEILPDLPVTIKCRIGIDNEESYDFIYHFIQKISETTQVKHFIIHARNAILKGKISAKDNRTIPPLKYHIVYRLVHDFPHLFFTLNGGIQTIEEIQEKLISINGNNSLKGVVHGTMVGRAVVNNPFYWRNVDSLLYHAPNSGNQSLSLNFCLVRSLLNFIFSPLDFTRRELLEKYCIYAIEQEKIKGSRIRNELLSPIFNLFHGELNGKLFRRLLTENKQKHWDKSIDTIIHMSVDEALSEDILNMR
jgi:tRNA-dihydrouridine synthase A